MRTSCSKSETDCDLYRSETLLSKNFHRNDVLQAECVIAHITLHDATNVAAPQAEILFGTNIPRSGAPSSFHFGECAACQPIAESIIKSSLLPNCLHLSARPASWKSNAERGCGNRHGARKWRSIENLIVSD